MSPSQDDVPFGGLYRGRRVLVTGHTGFKGSWLVYWLRRLGAQVTGLALPAQTRPSHHALLAPAIREAMVDLRDAEGVRDAIRGFEPEAVFHLAAQPLVRRGYREPEVTFATNVTGLIHLLEAVREVSSVRVLINATTDKCYLDLPVSGGYREDDRLGGHDPYSASKACSEIVSACWRESFLRQREGGPVMLATARAGNVIGGGDWSEDRLIPDLVRAAQSGREAEIRRPNAVRPWQHVLEPLAGYLLLGAKLLAGEPDVARAWNFGPDPDGHLSVAEVIRGFSEHWPALAHRLDPGPHPHETAHLRLDCGAARVALGWRPVWGAAESIARTALWYRRFVESGELRTGDDLDAYVTRARELRLPWASGGIARGSFAGLSESPGLSRCTPEAILP